MSNVDFFVKNITEDLNIKQEHNEKLSDWCRRMIYSIIGSIAITSLGDDESNMTSIVSYNRKLNKYLGVYKKIFESENRITDILSDGYLKENEYLKNIQKIYSKTGNMYHTKNNFVRPVKNMVSYGGVTYLRGLDYRDDFFMSGLGAYRISNEKDDFEKLLKMFGIEKKSITEPVDKLLEMKTWRPASRKKLKNAVFLRHNGCNYDYWDYEEDNLYRNERISLLKDVKKSSENEVYYIYKNYNNTIYLIEIDGSLIEYYGFEEFANAILKKNEVLPKIEYKVMRETVEITLNLRLPFREKNIIELYSWKKNKFKSVLNIDVFYSLKKFFEKLGYEFQIIS